MTEISKQRTEIAVDDPTQACVDEQDLTPWEKGMRNAYPPNKVKIMEERGSLREICSPKPESPKPE